MNIAALIPVLDRPERVVHLVDSLRVASIGHHVYMLFLVSPSDFTERSAIVEARDRLALLGAEDTGVVDWHVVEWEPGAGDYAKKINRGVNIAVARDIEFDWLFLGADDLQFQHGWLNAAQNCALRTNACVIGTNDLGNPSVIHREHSTHTLVSPRYLMCGTIDDPDGGKLLHEGYDHNFVDNEFIGTAMYRETYAQALDCHVEHLHPNWRKAAQDPTYTKGQRLFNEDAILFRQRQPLWGSVTG